MKENLLKNFKHFSVFLVGMLILVTLFFSFSKAEAAITKEINYQGRLTNLSDVNVADTSYNMIFRIYDAASGGTCLWSARGNCGAPTARAVTTSGGIFSIGLGDTAAGDNAINLEWDSTYYLSVQIGGDSEMTPRKKISASGYAFNANNLIGDGRVDLTNTSNTVATMAVTNNTATTIGNGANTLGVLDLQSTSLTTGNFLNMELNALTSGRGLNLSSTATGLSGDLASIIASGSNAGVTGSVLKVGLTGASAVGTALNITSAGSAGFALRVNDDGTYTDTTPFVVDYAGNVGIGTTNPTSKLQINGTLRTGYSGEPGRWRFYDSSGYLMSFWDSGTDYDTWGLNWDTSDNEMRWMGSGILRASVDLDDGSGYFQGNVGIGTTGPTARLTLAKATNSNEVLGFQRNSDSAVSGRIGHWDITGAAVSDNFSIWTSGGNPLTLGTNQAEVMRITNDGNVGIGTTSPLQKLDVAMSTGAVQIGNAFTAYTPATVDLVVGKSDGNSRFLFGQTVATYGGMTWNYNATIANAYLSITTNANNNNIVISPNGTGNVGIGTTAPGAKLEVGGQVKITGGSPAAGYVLTSDANGLASWGDISSSGGAWTLSGNNLYPDNTAYNIALGATDAGSAKLYMNGNLGIGTTSPSAQLGILGTNSGTVPGLMVASGYLDIPSGLKMSSSMVSDDLLFYLPFQGLSAASSRSNIPYFLRTDTTTNSTATYTTDSGWITHDNQATNTTRIEKTNIGHGIWVENSKRNILTYSSFEDGGSITGWTNSGLETFTTTASYRKHQSYAASLADSNSTGGQAYIAQTLTNAATYPFSCYAMNNTTGAVRGTVDSSVVQLWAGSDLTTTYTPVEGGWYRISGTITGTGGSVNYGVDVKANKAIYLDGCQIESNYNVATGVTTGNYPTTLIYTNGTTLRNRGEESLYYYVWRGLGGYESSDTIFEADKGTLSFWFRPEWGATAPTQDLYFTQLYDSSTEKVLRIYFKASDDKIYAEMYNGSNWTTVATASAAQTFSANTDHYLSFRWDNTSGTVLNIDGVETTYSGSWTAQTQQINTGTLLYIGSKGTTGGRVDALISDFAIFDRSLTAAEVTQIYKNKTPIEDYQRNDIVMLLNDANARSFQRGNIRVTGDLYGGSVSTSTLSTTYITGFYGGLGNAANYTSHIVMHLPFQGTIDGSRKEVGTFTRSDASSPAATAGEETSLKLADKNANEPRIDRGFISNAYYYDTSYSTGNPGIHIEESRKNVALYSSFEALTGWSAGASCTGAQATNRVMHGTNALNLTSTAACRYTQTIDFASVTAGTKHQISAYVWRNETNSWGGSMDATIASLYARTDDALTALTTVYTPLGNGWYRLTGEFDSTAASNWDVGVLLPSASRNVFVDSFQVERRGDNSSARFPTTYIPTVGTVLTRAAETLAYPVPASFKGEKGGFSLWFKPNWTRNITSDTTDKYLFYVSNVVRVRLDATSNDRLVIEHYNGSSWVATANTGTNTINQYTWNHLVCGWYFNYNYCRINGTAVTSSTTWTPQSSAGQTLYIGSDNSGVNQADAQIAGFALFDTFLDSAQQYQLYLNKGKFDDFYRTDTAFLSDATSTVIQNGSLYMNGSLRTGLGTAALPSFGFSTDSNTGMFSPLADTLAFSTGGTEKLRIDASGNVGIGTTNPGAYKLNVTGNTYLNGTVTITGGSPGENKVLTSDTNGLASWTTLSALPSGNSDTVDNVHIGSIAQNYMVKMGASSTLAQSVIYDDGTNVGIGTTSPRTKLDIYGGLTFGTASGSSAEIKSQENAGGGNYRDLTVYGNDITFRTSDSDEGVNSLNRLTIANTTGDTSILKSGGTGTFFQYSSGNVGIGTTGPTTRLTLAKATNSNEVLGFQRNSDSAVSGRIGHWDITGATASDNFSIWTSGGNPLTLGTNGSEWMRITSAGNVGIGTTAPARELEISGTGGKEIRITSTTAGTGTATLELSTPNEGIWFIEADDATGDLDIGQGANLVTIQDGGNVGIGTTGTDAKLDVAGKLKVGGNVATNQWSLNGVTIGYESDNSIGWIAAGGAAAYTNLVLNAGGGNVGIGTTSPGAKLEVNGDIYQGSYTKASENNLKIITISGYDSVLRLGEATDEYGFTIRYDGSDTNDLYFTRHEASTAGEVMMALDRSTGNIGIGTMSPGAKLDIKASAGGDALLRFSHNSSPTQAGIIMGLSSDQTKFEIKREYSDVIYDVMAIDRISGDVGIGITAPLALLHLYRDTTTTALGQAIIEQDGTGDASLQFGLTGLSNWITGIDNSDSDKFKISNSNTLGTSDMLTIDSSGNVGIGTTSPGAKLDIYGTLFANSGVTKILNESGFGTFRTTSSMRLATDANGMELNPTGFGIQFMVGGTEYIRLNSAGNVGIGTTSPGAKLHSIASSGVVAGRFNGVDGQNSLEIFGGATSGQSFGLLIDAGSTSGDYALDIRKSDNTAIMRVRGDGNVGIGTIVPTAQLSQKSTALSESALLGGEMTDANNWTSTAGWTGDYNAGFAHTAGTTTLSRTMSISSATLYQITFTITGRTAGSVTVGLGGETSNRTYGTNNTYGYAPKTLDGTGDLIFTPTTDFDGTISAISVKQITGEYAATYNILDNSGTAMLEIRSSSNSLYNQFIGRNAGRYNTTGNMNTASGARSFFSNTTGYYNTTNGTYSMYNNTTGYQNTANGAYSLYSNTTGYGNTVDGVSSMQNNTTGYYNTANGVSALFSNTTGYENIANGAFSLTANTTGYKNTANGISSLFSNSTGYQNTANGYNAGSYILNGVTPNQTSNNSLYLGYNTRALADGGVNEIVIGANAIGFGSNSVVLGSDSIATTILRGNVGIGTTAPINKLHVSDNSVSPILEIQGLLNSDTIVPNVYLSERDVALGYQSGFKLKYLGSSNRFAISSAAWTSGSETERLSILRDNGYVGIGTTSPGDKLHIYGGNLRVTQATDTGTNGIAIGESSGTYNAFLRRNAGASGNLVLRNGGVDTVEITTTGNVGIGTTDPTAYLHLKAGTATAGTAPLKFTSGTSLGTTEAGAVEYDGSHLYFTAVDAGTRYQLDQQVASITDNSLDFIKFEDTLDLDADLTLNQTAYTSIQNFTGTTTTGLTYNANSLTTGTAQYISSTSTALTTGGLLNISATGTPAASWTGDLAKIEYNSASDNVDGTALKLGLLGAAGGDGTVLNITTAQTGTAALAMRVNDDGTYTDSTPFVIDATGKLGVGTTAPTAMLEIYGTTNALKLSYNATYYSTLSTDSAGALSIVSTGTGGSFMYAGSGVAEDTAIVYDGNAQDYYLGLDDTDDALKIGLGSAVGTTPYITVLSSGNVGIGMDTPGYKLTVNGQPAANGYTAFTNYSDSRLKTNIQTLSAGYLDKIMAIKPATFNYNDLSGYDADTKARTVTGFIAQELQLIFPEMVGTTTIDGIEYFDTNLSALPIYLVKAIQEQQNQIAESVMVSASLQDTLSVQEKEMQKLSLALASLALNTENEKVLTEQKIDALQNNLNFGGSQINLLSAKLNLVDDQISQNIQEKIEVSFYQFAQGSTQLSTTVSDALVEDEQFSGTYSDPENFQEMRIDLSSENQIDLTEKELEESYLLYDVYIEDPSAFLDFNSELGNETDQKELQWNSAEHPFFLPGWNQVKLSLNSAVKTGSIDWQNLNYFRAYFKFRANNNLKFKNIRIETKAVYHPLAQTVNANELDLWNNFDQGMAIKDIFANLEIQKETNVEVAKLSQDLAAMEEQLSLLQEQTKAVIDFSLAMNLENVVYKDAQGSVLGLSIVQAEEVKAKKVKAEDYVVSENTDPLKNNVGSVIVRIGEQEVLVKNAGVTIDSKIIVTPVGSSPVSWVISDKINGVGFKIKLDKSAEFDIAFDYWVIGVEK